MGIEFVAQPPRTRMKNSLSQWLDYIGAIHTSSIDLGLERISVVARELNILSMPGPVITVGGTNGKGSCVTLLEATYQAAGYQVAAYTSPHLHIFNERLRLNGINVADQLWCAAFEQIEQARGATSLSFFEFTTLAAFQIIQQAAPDVVILEVGLGGRLDAVNIIDADVAIVTSIALDHTDWLGDSRELIGLEKAGIFRQSKPAICGDPDAPASLLAHAARCHAKLYCMDQEFQYQCSAKMWEWSSINTTYSNLPVPNIKLQNAATSLMALECLQSLLPVSESRIRQGLLRVALPGRFEVRAGNPIVVFDVAHNPASTAWLAEQLQTHFPLHKVTAVFGMLCDKDIAESVRVIKDRIHDWYVADLNEARGAKAAEIVPEIRVQSTKNCYTFASVAGAIDAALVACKNETQNLVVVFGSFHTVAKAREWLDQLGE